MKYNYIITLIAGLSLTFTSCGNDWLDEMTPQNAVETNKSLNTPTEAEYALNGIYNEIRKYEYRGARYTFYADATSEDMQARNDTKRVARYYLFQFNAVTSPSSFWRAPYAVIRNINNVLRYTNTFKEDDLTDQIKNIKGEALTLRALAHFDLVNIYGMPYTKDNGASLGVPVVIENLANNAKPARNTVAEVYKQVLDDLETAARYISSSRNDGKVNWYANQLLLARVYLYMGNDQKAFEISSNLIEQANKTGNYKLWSTSEYPNVWKETTSSELLFTLINNASEISDSKEFIGYLMHRSGYDDISLSSDYMDLLGEDPDDVRHKIIDKYKPSDYRWYLLKYVSPSYNYSNIPVLRLSEAYLIAAEAAVKLNKNEEALNYLNAIVQRANPEKEVTGTVTLERVLIERRKELVGEGHRFFDAMRNNQTITRKGKSHTSDLLLPETKQFDRNYFKIILAIPTSEINVNPNIVQNPGYGN
ncbi:RagB/SusD family nutrient uptake outer membrane protein [Massilibacteroides vaginae]|uniref:RagB/SusD family nutrient uptake outer membrane protein n=1 Tax=Massilibacteroides vaginae TaxID=1673718 RepID=UPI000A1CE098|nr:RagB/SusD family nutrient uptake outer membrane protein [Massilibacteroides vaginae]